MPRQREWTDRDLSILQELYELREMTKKQITMTRLAETLHKGFGVLRERVLRYTLVQP
jgi:hypothetical protein